MPAPPTVSGRSESETWAPATKAWPTSTVRARRRRDGSGAGHERLHGLFVALDLGLVECGPHVDGVGVGDGLHDERPVVVGEGHGERPLGRQRPGDVQAAPGEQFGAEGEPPRAVVVAGDQHHRHAQPAHDAFEDVVEQLDRVGGRHAAVVDVAGHDDGRGPYVGHQVDELPEHVGLVVGQMDGMKQPSEMPVGGMDESHARTL